MAKELSRTCAVFAFLLTICGSLQCVKAASADYYHVTSHLRQIDTARPVELTEDTLLHRQRRAAPGPIPVAPPTPAPTDVKNQYQSVNANANANGNLGSSDTTVTTVDSNAAAAVAAADSVSYNVGVHNVGVNGTGQRKDYSLQTGESAGNAATTTINVAANAELKKGGLQQSQYPKKATATATQQLQAAVVTTTTTEKPLIDDVDVSEEVIEKETAKLNLTIYNEQHEYYNSSLYVNKEEVQSMWKLVQNISENVMLSSSHRRAMTVELKFDFPFYGHYVRNITVATGGFLYTGEYVHSWLAATQYIAPLMANFDTSISAESHVRLQDNGTAFTVLWENVALQDKPDYGKFTFSATLHQNGNIVFVYYQVPTNINGIQDNQHPVKVGLSDAYIIDKHLYFSRRKTIYEYHRVTFVQQQITNATIIQLTALPTCLGYNDCQSCVNHTTSFTCYWCPIMNRCSTGTDRKKHEWMQKGCDRAAINKSEACPALGQKGNNAGAQDSASASNTGGNAGAAPGANPTPSTGAASSATSATTVATTHAGEAPLSSTQLPPSEADNSSSSHKDSERLDAELSAVKAETKSVGVAFGFLVPICLVFAVTLWLFYAYRNPHTKSGQLLIQFRPSQWSWRRGEARYTAATIHM
ncbi:plexin domain-containing protein 2 isoform X2 [Scaptodrosophila lebanonensis]|uniref:Plexin domain-containing protein 2 isoform X2 n=1 Tax=Drosophila lebanonensis TaxID=7225 RepID=A0A6J2TZG4_DROLE|nr:plexin domain-containing protein 2 isoform X2 [Scaptodrosophila lebanonensis]